MTPNILCDLPRLHASENGSWNHCYRSDTALKIGTRGYFEVNFSFLRVPVNSFEQGPLFWPRIALFWARNSKRFEKCIFYV